ncbi:hypothetical protein TWF569_010580 [Orbilia oligospora]|uniref:F-box domain-containing protein n=1 Tax=Orbilia oligospora TaxID=2813651 RepID=A0A7C8K2N9_ORBOL|nr:hypothetical protein TWF103_007243 [Orbilia oligospora]KAF3109154.1 hypothetical protein TWF102_009929 [Orbilia oligospora]KAF3141376.1 hypothetical protein TWF703_002176 [Orbilia oligospora]KAF3148504.1 hypothetical protein TWF594_000916 [Orbilia oligospora]KAF3154959.1 hypothetical protein TWF569_010580 [Orbilia oligospora]
MSPVQSKLRDIHIWMAEENDYNLPGCPEEIDWGEDYFYEPDAGINLLVRKSSKNPFPVTIRAGMQGSGKIFLWCNGPCDVRTICERYLPVSSQCFIPRRISPPDEPVLLASIPTSNPPVFQTSILHNFPQEIFLKVCGKLRLNDLVDLSQTCRSFLSMISQEQLLWYSKLQETQHHPLGLEGFDNTINYFGEAVKYLDDITESPNCCRQCLSPSAQNRTFVGKVNPVFLCETCLHTSYPDTMPFHLPIPTPHIALSDWGYYVVSWYRYGRLVPGMTFHSYFSRNRIITLIEKGQIRMPKHFIPSDILQFLIKPVLENVPAVGRFDFEGGDQFSRFQLWNNRLQWNRSRDTMVIRTVDGRGLHALGGMYNLLSEGVVVFWFLLID